MNVSLLLATSIAVIVISGCATYSEMKERPVAYTTSTEKAPDVYAECLLPRVMDASAASHVVKDGRNLTLVVPVGGGSPDAVMMAFTVTPNGNGSVVEMRHMTSLSNFNKQWAQALSCI